MKKLTSRAKPGKKLTPKPFKLRVGMIGVRRDKKRTGPLEKNWPSMRPHTFWDPNHKRSYLPSGSYWSMDIQDPKDLIAEYKPKRKGR